MRVLVLEGEKGAADQAAEALAAAGHDVARCHDTGSAAFPCRGMLEGQSCPLESDQVDVAVVVRGEPGDEPTAGEDGVRCALRRYIPLVVAGEVSRSPYTDWAAVVAPGTDSVVDAVDEAVSAPLRRHADAARRSFRSVLEHHDIDSTDADAEVVRAGADLQVILRPVAPVEHVVAEMASVRAVGAVRDLDPYPRVIDVTIEPTG